MKLTKTKLILTSIAVLFVLVLAVASSHQVVPLSHQAAQSSPAPSVAATTAAIPNPAITASQGASTPPRATLCQSVAGLPDPSCTPGVVDPAVTQDNIHSTICVSGYTAKVRPSTSYTSTLKAEQIKQYGYADANLSHYEEDHLIPLEVGGAPSDPKNLWPEYGSSPNAKDTVENRCHSQVCNGQITLAKAQLEIIANWHTACSSAIPIIPVPIPISKLHNNSHYRPSTTSQRRYSDL